MHVGKLMARLNPKNVRFDVGSGGIPELTSTDIAGALGMVPAGLGRELLCRVWWLDGADLMAKDLSQMLLNVLHEEWARREQAMLDGLLSIAIHKGGESFRFAQRRYAHAHDERWPRFVLEPEIGVLNPVYPNLARCVVAEISEPKHCPGCGGRGEVRTLKGISDCGRCDGSGTVSYGNTQRAKQLGVEEYTYRRTWDKTYVWMLNYCNDALRDAARALERMTA